jgi:hypothetical protein
MVIELLREGEEWNLYQRFWFFSRFRLNVLQRRVFLPAACTAIQFTMPMQDARHHIYSTVVCSL